MPALAHASPSATLPDFNRLRAAMVVSQLKVSKVTDESVIIAMGAVPREAFVSADRAVLAYADQDVPLGQGRYLMQPMVLARLLDAAAVRPGARALVIGAGTGYASAVLAEMGATVTALESDPALIAHARSALAARTITVVEGDLAAGHPAAAPYDIILMDGAFDELPAALAVQLAESGVCVGVQRDGQIGRGVVGRLSAGTIRFHAFMDAQVHPLAAFTRTRGFTF